MRQEMMGFWDAKKSNNAQYQKCKINLDLNEARGDRVLDAVASATQYANNPQRYYLHHFHTLCNILKSIYNKGGSIAEWLACWIQAQKARVQIAVARFITHVTCRLTAKNQDQLRNPTLGNRVWATFTFSYITNSTTADL